jgi:hypothetical protein
MWFFSRAKRRVFVISLFVLAFNLSGVSLGKYSGGTGEPDDPYRIATPNDLNDIGYYSEDFNKHFIMVNDINLAAFTGAQFNIIGFPDEPFTGSFDGNGHTISNFTYNSVYVSNVALFAYAEANCVIKDLTFYEPNILGGNYTAALVGRFGGGLVSNIHIISGNISGHNIVAGLISWCNSGVITNCSSWADVNCGSSGGSLVGGLVAVSYADIYNSFATGDVKGYVCVGGLIGFSHAGIVSDCYAKGNVTGHHDVGGFIGGGSQDLDIYRCYAVGLTSGVATTGGFAGTSESTSYTKCFWDNDFNPDVNGIGDSSDPNVFGLPTAQMQQRSTFTDAGWDMVEVWDIGENQTYPFLRKHLPSDINKDNETNFSDMAILAVNWLKEK